MCLRLFEIEKVQNYEKMIFNISDSILKVNDEMNRWFTLDCEEVVCANICCSCDQIVYPSNISWISEKD